MLELQTGGTRPGLCFTLLNVVFLATLSLKRAVEMLFVGSCRGEVQFEKPVQITARGHYQEKGIPVSSWKQV